MYTNIPAISDARLGLMDEALKALADPTRLRILGLLSGGEVSVCDIYDSLAIPQPKASRHLAYLRKSGLVAARKQGLWVHYRLAPVSDKVIKPLIEAVTHCLGHIEAINRDRQRLELRTGCGIQMPARHPDFDCCRPVRRSTADRRRLSDRRQRPRAPK